MKAQMDIRQRQRKANYIDGEEIIIPE